MLQQDYYRISPMVCRHKYVTNIQFRWITFKDYITQIIQFGSHRPVPKLA